LIDCINIQRTVRLSAILTAVIQNFNLNNSAKSEVNSKIVKGVNQGPKWFRFMKKTEVENLMLLSL
jgi:hypothetical protein